MRVLVVNVGSSSIKYAGFHSGKRLFDAYVENIRSLDGYDSATAQMLTDLEQRGFAPQVFAHRIVHGAGLTKTTRFTKQVRKRIEEGQVAAPLHNTPQLRVLDALEKRKAKQVCVFDSLSYDFADTVRTIPIDQKTAKKYGLTRVGFHGISHTSIHKQTNHLGNHLITVHLGSGSSVTAWKGKKALWNSMDFTPQGGVLMATRPGTMDPGLVPVLLRKGLSLEQIEDLLTNRSGLKGLAGTSDLKTILDDRSKPQNTLAITMLIDSISETIARAAVHTGGVDAIAFSGTIGLRSNVIRNAVIRKLSFLKPFDIAFVKTDEEQVIYDETVALLKP